MDNPVILLGACVVILVAAVIALIAQGLRTGDRPGDVLVLEVEPEIARRGVTATLTNRGGIPVISARSTAWSGCRRSMRAPRRPYRLGDPADLVRALARVADRQR